MTSPRRPCCVSSCSDWLRPDMPVSGDSYSGTPTCAKVLLLTGGSTSVGTISTSQQSRFCCFVWFGFFLNMEPPFLSSLNNPPSLLLPTRLRHCCGASRLQPTAPPDVPQWGPIVSVPVSDGFYFYTRILSHLCDDKDCDSEKMYHETQETDAFPLQESWYLSCSTELVSQSVMSRLSSFNNSLSHNIVKSHEKK